MTFMLASLFPNITMKKYILGALVASFLISLSFGFVAAAEDPLASIACIPGKTLEENRSKCGISQIGNSIRATIRAALQIFFIVLLIALAGSILFDFWKTGASAQFYVENKKRFTGVVVGLLGLAFMFGGSLDMLRELGVPEEYMDYASFLLSLLPIEHAYAAQTVKPLLGGSYLDIIMRGVKVLWTWIVFPIMIAGWFFAGFKYVAAQGSPEKIKEAHGVLTAIVLVTVFVLFVQGFLSSLF